jgi:putative oxidoreductase
MERLVTTDDAWPPAVARLALGVVMFSHAAQKMLGWFWFGRPGFTAAMGFFAGQGIPAPVAFFAIVAELFGSLAVIVGLLGRVAAFGIFCFMVVSLGVHLPNGFFMNWFGNQAGEGIEYHLLVRSP